MTEQQHLIENEDLSRFGCRHILALLAFIGFVIIFGLRVNMSVALVAMTNYNPPPRNTTPVCPNIIPVVNHTLLTEGIESYNWNFDIQGWILGAFFYGYLFSPIPAGILAQKIGGKRLFAFGVFSSSLMTMLVPMAARQGPIAVFTLRLLSGFGEGVTMPSIHFLLGKWAPLSERSQLTAFSYAGMQIGVMLALMFSGIISSSATLGGWPTTFYLFGAIGCVFSGVWMVLIYDTPAKHPRIRRSELIYIEKSSSTHQEATIPWKSMLTSPPVYALMVGHATSFWIFYLFLTGLPTYMVEILAFNISEVGYITCAPFLISCLVSNSAGYIADHVMRQQYVSTLTVRKICLILGFGIPAFLLCIIQFSGCNLVTNVAIVYLTVGINGFAFVTVFSNHLDLSPDFAGTLMGISNSVATISGMVAPLVTGYLTNIAQSRAEWQIVFYVAAVVLVSGTIMYMFLASGEVQEWGVVKEPMRHENCPSLKKALEVDRNFLSMKMALELDRK